MPVSFGVICDTVLATGETVCCITISEALCKTTLFTFLKAGLEKGKRKRANSHCWDGWLTPEHSISVTNCSTHNRLTVNILEEKQQKFLPVSFLSGGQWNSHLHSGTLLYGLILPCTHWEIRCRNAISSLSVFLPFWVAVLKLGRPSEKHGARLKILQCNAT